jgi:hypothetical protein
MLNLNTEIEVDDQCHALASLTLGKSLVSLYSRPGEPQEQSGGFGEGKNPLPTPGFEPCNTQPLASCYTNYANLAPLQYKVWCSADSPLYSHHFEFHQVGYKT